MKFLKKWLQQSVPLFSSMYFTLHMIYGWTPYNARLFVAPKNTILFKQMYRSHTLNDLCKMICTTELDWQLIKEDMF